MAEDVNDSDLLVPFELANITGEYRNYYKIKRNNFFATIQFHQELWECFQRIDAIWKREIEDLGVSTAPNGLLPLILYTNAHAKLRISVELGFTTCMQECRSILRDAVENVAHAHHMLRDPANAVIWLNKDEKNGKAPFHQCFEANKKKNLFDGLAELYEKYGQLSESGSHSTVTAMHNRISFTTTPDGKAMRLHYTGVPDARTFALEMFSRLLTCYVMEQTLYRDYQTHLQRDDQLAQMRREFELFKEDLRRKFIVRYNIQPPAQKLTEA